MTRLKQLFILISLFLSLCLLLPTATAAEETTSIVCTNSFLADFTSQLITENVTIEYIMPAGACPAHFDTCPSDVTMITSADLIISLGWEPWLTSILEASEQTDIPQITTGKIGEWSLPQHAQSYVTFLRDELIKQFPNHNATITANAASYLAEINSTAQTLRDQINASGYQGVNVISISWYQELLEWLGVAITTTYGPPEGLSTQDMLNITQQAEQNNVAVIIDNLQSGTEFGANVAAQAGISHVIFSNFPGAVPNTDSYLDTLTYNVEQLQNGIATYEYRQGDIATLEDQLQSIELQRNIAFVAAAFFFILTLVGFLLYIRKK